jgi:NADH-quinone oxidoreductase subunit L
MDEIYDTLFVNPTKRLGTFLWKGFDVVVVDGIVNGFGKVVNACSKGLRFTQSGFVHNYALSMVIGVLVIVGIYVLR